MGRGDKRTAKGKRFKGSYGNSRPHVEAVKVVVTKKEKAAKKDTPAKDVTAKKAPPRKAAAKKED
jgi:ribosomal small subunit protein bTHX